MDGANPLRLRNTIEWYGAGPRQPAGQETGRGRLEAGSRGAGDRHVRLVAAARRGDPTDLPLSLGAWFYTQDATVGVVGQQVKQSVRTLADVADAFAQVRQQPLLMRYLRPVELEPNQQGELQRPHEQVAAPRREPTGGVERHTGRRDRRIPIVDGLLEAGLGGTLADLLAGVIATVGNDRPAVILAGFGDVDLVTALRAVLDRPQPLRLRVERRRLYVAMTERPESPVGHPVAPRTGCPSGCCRWR